MNGHSSVKEENHGKTLLSNPAFARNALASLCNSLLESSSVVVSKVSPEAIQSDIITIAFKSIQAQST